ncbi:carbohydrate-binding family 9-like protein [Spirochaetota bacterium]
MPENVERHTISNFYGEDIADTAHRVNASFRACHDAQNIIITFYVRELYPKAELTEDNAEVYKESCVEFFIQVHPERKGYYNFEFNCIGTCLVQFGEKGSDRTYIDPGRIASVRRYPSLGRSPVHEQQGDIEWKLTAVIPVDFFYETPFNNLSGSISKANFFKCGDELTYPHWASWSKIESKEINFHQPSFFGEIRFE